MTSFSMSVGPQDLFRKFSGLVWFQVGIISKCKIAQFETCKRQRWDFQPWPQLRSSRSLLRRMALLFGFLCAKFSKKKYEFFHETLTEDARNAQVMLNLVLTVLKTEKNTLNNFCFSTLQFIKTSPESIKSSLVIKIYTHLLFQVDTFQMPCFVNF